MRWSEEIMVRTSGRHTEALASILQELSAEVAETIGRNRIRVCRREGIDTDFSIVLSHECDTIGIESRRLGLRLNAALKEFGLVHHTIWKEMETVRFSG